MPTLQLSEDLIDDLLYFCRASDIDELKIALDQASRELEAPPHDVLTAAVDSGSGNTVLHMAAANGHTEMVKVVLSLIPAPVDMNTASRLSTATPTSLINIPNQSGNTPLHWAALNGHLSIVKLLVDAGANLLAKNNAGHDVAFEAELAGKEEVVNWLLSAAEANQVKGADVEEDIADNTDSENHTVDEHNEDIQAGIT